MTDPDEAFVEFVHAASPQLLRAALYISGDPQAAEDLVQSALEKVYVRWSRLRDEQPIAYARRCILNSHINTTRRRWRLWPVAQVPERPHHVDWPEGSRDLASALKALSLRERQILVMRYCEDLSEAAVAQALGVSTGTVKSTASRALAKLRTTLPVEGDARV